MGYWERKRVLVTGGNGFLGRHVVEGLERRGCNEVIAPRSSEYDLRDPLAARRILEDTKPDHVIHLAAVVGGIGANREQPGTFFYDNMSMGLHLIEESRRSGVEKFVCIGTICAYPKTPRIPFCEDDIWDGYPEETNAPYGLAKRALLVQLQAYREQFGFSGIYLLPVNLYGPGDNFDLVTGHVIPNMIRKFEEARTRNTPEVELWGDGTPTREFLYVTDAADGILLAAERYSGSEPVNLGSGVEISIADLAEKTKAAVGYAGEIKWNTDMPNGQPRRLLDVSRAKQAFGFEATTPFDTGLDETVAWFRRSMTEGASR